MKNFNSKRVLIACEYSGIVRTAFSRLGWDAWSCDILPTEIPGNHIQNAMALQWTEFFNNKNN